ncbi:MAG TPA: response regulator transcription factor, partial [Micropepsaceae bacterium]|nr:response regulator transcription factor [Micropepsaceae bacterium]
MSETKARIFIVDDHPLVREWLTNLIEKTPDLTVCGGTEDAANALKMIGDNPPDLAIIDLSLGNGSGMELIQSIRSSFPSVAMIVLSMHDEEVYAEHCIRAGARGYVMKRETAKNIIDAIHEVLEGNLYLSKRMTAFVVQKMVSNDVRNGGAPLSQLSERELQVFKLLGQSHGIDEIAKMLDLNIKTVHTYCARIKEKIKVRTTADLLQQARLWQG